MVFYASRPRGRELKRQQQRQWPLLGSIQNRLIDWLAWAALHKWSGFWAQKLSVSLLSGRPVGEGSNWICLVFVCFGARFGSTTATAVLEQFVANGWTSVNWEWLEGPEKLETVSSSSFLCGDGFDSIPIPSSRRPIRRRSRQLTTPKKRVWRQCFSTFCSKFSKGTCL